MDTWMKRTQKTKIAVTRKLERLLQINCSFAYNIAVEKFIKWRNKGLYPKFRPFPPIFPTCSTILS